MLLRRLAIQFLLLAALVHSTVYRCQDNCFNKTGGPGGRLPGGGPTHPAHTRAHPWKRAEFPSRFQGFCKLGCQFFFSENPNNITCNRACRYQYRYHVTVGYSDLAEVAINECEDGCDIALKTCQEGYYCTQGSMTACPAGRFRSGLTGYEPQFENVTDKGRLVETCIDCPVGRYRPLTLGVTPDDCSKCPIGTYSNATGMTSINACIRCPAGMTAEEEGMDLCKCITPGSCDYVYNNVTYYKSVNGKDGADFYRERVPYDGRS